MWQSLRTNDIQMVSTDHCPFCMKDQKGRGIEDFSKMDYSAWEGYEIDGHVDTVLSRGKVVIDGGHYLGAKGDGRYIKRGLSQYLI